MSSTPPHDPYCTPTATLEGPVEHQTQSTGSRTLDALKGLAWMLLVALPAFSSLLLTCMEIDAARQPADGVKVEMGPDAALAMAAFMDLTFVPSALLTGLIGGLLRKSLWQRWKLRWMLFITSSFLPGILIGSVMFGSSRFPPRGPGAWMALASTSVAAMIVTGVFLLLFLERNPDTRR